MPTKTKAKAKRRGPGRPALPAAERVRTINTALSPAQIAVATRIGDGSPQEGIRRLIDRA